MSVETPEYAAMVERMIRAYGRRVGEADEVDLARMLEVREAMNAAVVAAVVGQRARGLSWAEIARGLGTTRQSAQMTYGRAAQAAAEADPERFPSSRSLEAERFPTAREVAAERFA